MATKIQKNQIATTLIDGWTPADATWTYASASTITVPSGAASIYQKGDRIKWTQTTVKYGVIVAVADTLLTIAVNTDYTVANAAILANYYSHQANPLGYPNWFAYTPTYTGFSSNPSGSVNRFSVVGNVCFVTRYFVTQGTSNSASFTITAPITESANSNFMAINTWDNGAYVATPGQIYLAGGVFNLAKTWSASSGFTSSGTKDAQYSIFYGI